MARNKNALLRYHTIDRCLRNTRRQWTLEDLVNACSDALYETEGKDDNVSTRTIQLDIQVMRSDRLGFEAPIEVYNRKYYRYSDPDYSINKLPLSEKDISVLHRSIDLLRQFDEFEQSHSLADLINRMEDTVACNLENRKPIVHFDHNKNLKGLNHLNGLYNCIAEQNTISVKYLPFKYTEPLHLTIFPHMLKEYNNRWFLFGSGINDMGIFNLALDRIIDFRARPEIPYKHNPNFNETYFNDIIGVSRPIDAVKEIIRLKCSYPNNNYILTKPIHHSQKVVEQSPDNKSTTIEIEAIINYELISLLLSLGPTIKVISPQSLVNTIKESLQKSLHNYT